MNGGRHPGRGVAASGHACVTGAALDVLRAGGNAFDGAIAAGFASALAEPALTSLGGGGFLLAQPRERAPRLFDFFVDTPGRNLGDGDLEPHFLPVTVRFPGSEQVFNTGRGSAAVPGNLKGFLHVHARLGRLPLADVLAPAIRLAREGVSINAHQGYFLDLLRPIMTLTAAGRSLYAPGGRLLAEGDRFENPDLAGFLESLPEGGARDFYEGGLARRIARDMRDGQGLIGEEDLAAFAVIERAPLEVGYRGHRLLTNPPPSFGGSLLALSLLLLEASWNGSAPGSAGDLLALASVMREVERLRTGGCLGPGDLSADARRRSVERIRIFSRGTTHLAVCDAEGNAASMTTSNGEGSGYVAPGTGIMLNNMLGEDDLHPEGFHASPPGQRVASMMSPCVLLRDGEVRLVLGSGGSKRIRTALLQVIHRFADCGLPIRDAVEHPRLHWDGEQLQAEPGFEPAALDALRRHHAVNTWDRTDVYFGGVHAVVPGLEGAGDPRRGGFASVVDGLRTG
ncbi:MAG: gamma-glutamyltransferase [Deltaproteobacteria bacterium]|nr:MAG: gamma-glutamyltransferase [Deltaproteobacteria bacterium]